MAIRHALALVFCNDWIWQIALQSKEEAKLHICNGCPRLIGVACPLSIKN
jgi:hypothetical protein